MRRTKKTILAGGTMAAIMALGAGPAAAAEEGDFEFSDGDNEVEEFGFEDGSLEMEFSDGGDLDLEGLDLEGIDGDDFEFSDGDLDVDTNSDVDTDSDSDVDTGSSNSVDSD